MIGLIVQWNSYCIFIGFTSLNLSCVFSIFLWEDSIQWRWLLVDSIKIKGIRCFVTILSTTEVRLEDEARRSGSLSKNMSLYIHLYLYKYIFIYNYIEGTSIVTQQKNKDDIHYIYIYTIIYVSCTPTTSLPYRAVAQCWDGSHNWETKSEAASRTSLSLKSTQFIVDSSLEKLFL